jgi:predicted nucleotidyltransferase
MRITLTSGADAVSVANNVKPIDENSNSPSRSDLTRLREQLAPLYEDPEIDLVVLFGSRAAGEGHAESDIDLAIRGEAPLDLVAVTNRVTRLLRTDRVDLVDLRRASPLLLREVARRGWLLYERSPGLYVMFSSLAHRRYVDTAKLRAAQREAIRNFLRERGVA